MKRLSIALAAVGISVSALAALPAATDPTLVAVPQLPGGFFVGGQAYYLQPSDTNGDLDYATVVGIASDSSSAFTTVNNINPDYDWGWGVNAGYIFPGTGNDIEASYFHLDVKDSASVAGVSGPVNLTTDSSGNLVFGYPVPFASPIAAVDPVLLAGSLLSGIVGVADTLSNVSTTGNFIESSVKYTLNRVDVTAGQYIDVGCRLTLHPKVGLTWAEVKRDLTTDAVGSVSGTVSTLTPVSLINDYRVDVVSQAQEYSKFNGVGPIFGLDSTYYIAYGFGAVAHVDALLLVGNMNSDRTITTASTVTNTTTGVVSPTTVTYVSQDIDSTRRVVPVLDGKLGLDYTFVFNNTANSDLTLEAGWQFSNYFNAIDRQVTIPHSTSDLGLNGPYVSLVFHV